MHKGLTANATLVVVIGCLVLANLVSVNHFARLDLTRDRAFTLSAATRDVVEHLEDPVTIKAYFSDTLPPPYSDTARYVKDLLSEYRAASNGHLSFEFIDPQSAETSDDKEKKKEIKHDIFGRAVREKTSVETELETLGIAPVDVRVFGDSQSQSLRVYMGVAVRAGENKEALPVVKDVSAFEYELTSTIRRLTQKSTDKHIVGIVQGHGEPSPTEQLQRLVPLIEQNYKVEPVTLVKDGKAAVPDDVDALLVIGPSQAYSDDEQRAIDDFLMKGKSAAFFLDRTTVDLRSFQPTPGTENLDALVASYGIEVGAQLVADVSCMSVGVPEQRGAFTIQQERPDPFLPRIKSLEGNSPLSKGIANITLPFTAPLYPKPVDGVEIESVAKSSPKSWLEDATAEGLSPKRDFDAAGITFTGPYTVMAHARGVLTSHFDSMKKSQGEARVVVGGSSLFLHPQVLGPPNAALLLNVIDWLLLDSKMLDMRARGLVDPPFDPALSDTARQLAKAVNIVGAPLLLLVFGLVRWRVRTQKRARLKSA